ncbi:putative amine oxidase [Crocosphaera subtropica ATCC 51142]|uniref:Amine oxidase n=1 Tax=Crocosphaera subtropica (strain ATCC 51142 / BH68) TaxID=43989 RepID=B1WPL3_CROS5|nr:FAD-dependent oxidoreductase [Crocosphaera subtropica]ACB51583.1 putative amine oxidase [Crocosphaera subtropica ATCC 51142]
MVSRRTFFKIFGVGSLVGLITYSRFKKPSPSFYQQDSLTLPYRLSKPKSVVIMGGGLAGLACAYELSKRGFAVTLLEKSTNLGGKIASWMIKVGSDSFKMEHGFHGFFPQYYNLKKIVSELNIENNFRSLEFYSVLFADNKYNYQPENFYPSHSAFPWNIMDLAVWSDNRLNWGINITKLSHWQVFKEITGFKIPDSFQRLDHLSVIDWSKIGFPQGLYDLYFLPFARSTLNAPDVLSAGELLQFFHFYFFGNPEGLAFNGTKDDMGTSLVNPLVAAIQNNNGKVITEVHISHIICQQNKITSMNYQQGNEIINVPFKVGKNTILSDQKNSYYGTGDRLFLETDEKVISLRCTHQGCTVKKQENGTFLCPCHGAVYDNNGKVSKGPAKQDLSHYQIVRKDDDSVDLVRKNVSENNNFETLQADYYVMATDVPGIKQLWTRIEGDNNETLTQKIEQLAIADPFAVARFWFDQDFDWEYSNFTSLSGYKLTDSITLYHRIQNQFIDWAKKTGGSVVELHAYCYKEKDFPTQEILLQTFEEELYTIVPKLSQATLLHKELVNQKNFSGYPPNSHKNRPETVTEIDNLFFAGDWVKMPFPCGLMERAVSSGLLAANAILEKEGLQRRTLLTVNQGITLI